jgi:SAM-dependent methyltransferase
MEREGFTIVRCPACGYSFAVLPADLDLGTIYQDEAYWNGGTVHGYPSEYAELAPAIMTKMFAERLRQIAAFAPPPRTLLEIGCASGHFLSLARTAGYQVEGLEIGAPMRAICAQRVGCPLYSSLEEVEAAGRRYQCVVMYEVLEHLPDPPAMLRRIVPLLVPGGLLTVSTPNFEGVGAELNAPGNVWFVPPAHIAYFGPNSLLRCLELGGFKPLLLEQRLDREPPLPAPLAALLGPLRRGKRMRPRGIIGRWLKAYYLRQPDAARWMDCLVAYARVGP